ncbi:PREDICTED: peptide chain release factor 1, mitochondrial isoform X2 [Nanorana parkeri]|uniref:peptide chain release factor 1, mitochondrial isoform X1 n=1 Tax=Nanorana parkeri TaxID=125878 RepID=UPI0008546FD4|nr:PREDICTED: peptide chain release factor 1, mitochondrial isoform X1 [Nanorana parkeri]XP_018415986.1 PREDICTED: peptide chain release factor 1, mitochondrial isoform X2 [Nanorana parkeri]
MKRLPGFALWRSCTLCFHSGALEQPSRRLCATIFIKQPVLRSHHENRCPLGVHGLQPRRSCSHGMGALWHNVTLQNYLQSLVKEHGRLGEMLNRTLKEEERKTLSIQHAQLSSLCSLLFQIQEAEEECKELDAMCADLTSREEEQLLSLALEEKDAINQNITRLRTKLLQLLVPPEKYDKNDAILEVVSGRTTGGDICQQFTGEIFDMYQNYAHYKSWTFEILNYTAADCGGLHHAAARIAGEGVYKRLKYEGGVHRVQRIPQVGLSSRMQRIHTGTMAVIVLPQPDEVDIKIDPKELRIDTFRAKGAGGQHVNTTDSAVRIVHIPTGISTECQEGRSQIMNKETAMKMLRAKLFEQKINQELSQRKNSRKLQVGTRDQSDRIRTYNFTQDRLTDHRISFESRNLKEFINGEDLLEDLIERLQQSADAEALLEVIENDSLSLNR